MLNVICSAILSFTIIGGQASEPATCSTIYQEYDISSLNTEELDVGYSYVGFHGRHSMIKIDGYEDRGVQCVELLSKEYNGKALTNFEFTESITSIDSSTVSTKEIYSSEISTGLQVKAGIPGATVTSGLTSKEGYTIENTVTYTTTNSSTFTVKFEFNKELLKDKIFALCTAANVYKITWQTWEYDNYWWGNYEVSGSRATHEAYITANPYTSVYVKGEGVIK